MPIRLDEPVPRVIFVDVDDTLLRSVGSVRIVIPAVVARVRELYEVGAQLWCWSSGGAAYARASAEELGLVDCFEGFLPKPNVLIDDQSLDEWRGLRCFHPTQVAAMNAVEILSAD